MTRNISLATVAFAVLLALSLPAGVGLGGASSTTTDNLTTVDADHPVASDDAVAEFQETGQTSGHVGAYDLNLTVAENSEDVGVDSALETDFNAVYLRADYDETIERSIRVYIPSDMWYPHRVDGEEPIQGNTVADFDTVGEGNYTAVTLHFDGEDDAVYRISKEAATIFEMRAKSSTMIENVTGYEPPKVLSSTDWEYPDDAFAENESTVAFEHDGDLVVEYDSDDTPGRERWVNVPACDSSSGSDAPVCEFERDGVENTTYVTARDADAPPIRYTDKRSVIDTVRSTVINDLQAALDDFRETAESYLPSMIVPAPTDALLEVSLW